MLSPEETLATQRRRGIGVEILRIMLPVLVLAAGVGGFLALSSLGRMPTQKHPTSPPPPPLVETVSVENYDQGIDIETDGLVVPYREINVSAEVAGRIKFKADICRAGNYVTEGTLLLEIDPIDYELEVRRLTKEWEQAKVMSGELDVEAANTEGLISLADEEVKLQRRELERLRSLSGNRFVSDSKVDEAARGELTARNALMRLRSQLRLLTTRRARLIQGQELVATQLEKAQLDQKRTKVLAPLDGVIVEEMVEQDSYVQKGTSLFRFEDTSSVEVKCALRMKELYWVWQQRAADDERTSDQDFARGYQVPRTPVSVIYRLNGRQYVWEGTLARYESIGLDEKTRTVPCRVVVEDPRAVRLVEPSGDASQTTGPAALVRGMYVSLVIHTRPVTALLKIPEQGVRSGNFVWLLEEGKLRRQDIRISHLLPDGVLVDADHVGLESGTRIVVSPLSGALDGMAVREKQSS